MHPRITIALVAVLTGASLLALVPTGESAVSFGSYGSFVDQLSARDFAPSLTTPTTEALCLGYLVDPNNPTDASKRAWMFHIAADGTCAGETVSTGRTFRLTAFGGSASLRWITTSDTTYINKAFDDLKAISGAATWLCYLEADGLSGNTAGDPVYIDREGFEGSGVSGTLSINDLRLMTSSSSGISAVSGSLGLVRTSDNDLKEAADTDNNPTELPLSETFTTSGGACGGFTSSALDLGAKGSFNDQDVYYLIGPDALSTTHVAQGMTRLTTSAGVTGGQLVLNGNSDHRDILGYVASTGGAADGICTTCTVSLVHTTATETIAKQLYLHVDDPDGTDDDVLYRDIVVKKSTTTSAGSPGSQVTSASDAGLPIDGPTLYALEQLLYYIDTDGDSLYEEDEPVYIKHPDNTAGGLNGGSCGATGSDRCVEVNDIRVRVPGQSAGSLVKSSDTDFTSYKTSFLGHTGFFLKVFQERTDARTELKSVSNAKFIDVDADTFWDPGTENVYIHTGSTVTDGARRVWSGGAAVDETVTCPGAGDCDTALRSESDFRTSGPDSTWETSKSEYLYYTDDQYLTIGDYRVHSPGALSTGTTAVASGDADLDQPLWENSNYQLYASFDSACPGACFQYPQAGDIKLSPSWGTVLAETASEVVPSVTVVTPDLVRADLGQASNLVDDVYYLDFSGSFTQAQVLRLTPYTGKAAGTFLKATDTAEISATKLTDTDASNDFGYIETGTTSGFASDDWVYLNLPDPFGGTTGSTLSVWDARMVPMSTSSGSFQPGTRVVATDGDHNAFGGDTFDGTSFKLLWWDANRNGVTDDEDAVWLHQGTGTPTTVGWLDVRLSGSGGSSGGGGGGGGGGGSPPPPPSSTPPSIVISVPAVDSFVPTGQAMTLSGTASGGTSSGVGNTVTGVAVSIDGNPTGVTGTTSWTAAFTPPADGVYTITATVTTSAGTSASATRTFTANPTGAAPPAMVTCPDGSQVPSGSPCPTVDEEAREDAEEARELAQEAKEAADEASAQAEQARDAAEGARDAAEENQESAQAILERLGNRSAGTDDTPAPGLLLVLAAVALAILVRRR